MKKLNKFLCSVLLCFAFSTKSFSADVDLNLSIIGLTLGSTLVSESIISVKVTYKTLLPDSSTFQELTYGPFPITDNAFAYYPSLGLLDFNLISFGPSLTFNPMFLDTRVQFQIELCNDGFAYEFPVKYFSENYKIPSGTTSPQSNPVILPDLYFDDIWGGIGVEDKPTFALRFSNESQNSFLNPILSGQDTVGFDFKFFANEGSVISGNLSGNTPTSFDSSFGLEEAISLEGSFRTPNNTSVFQNSIFTFEADTTKVKFGNSTPWGNSSPILYLGFENSVTALNLDSSKQIYFGAINYFPIWPTVSIQGGIPTDFFGGFGNYSNLQLNGNFQTSPNSISEIIAFFKVIDLAAYVIPQGSKKKNCTLNSVETDTLNNFPLKFSSSQPTSVLTNSNGETIGFLLDLWAKEQTLYQTFYQKDSLITNIADSSFGSPKVNWQSEISFPQGTVWSELDTFGVQIKSTYIFNQGDTLFAESLDTNSVYKYLNYHTACVGEFYNYLAGTEVITKGTGYFAGAKGLVTLSGMIFTNENNEHQISCDNYFRLTIPQIPDEILEGDFNQIQSFALSQNYPNPFNPKTVINYELQTMNYENAKLVIFNILGERVKEFVLSKPKGSVIWNGTNEFGKEVSSGVYFYKIIVNEKSSRVKKMVFLK